MIKDTFTTVSDKQSQILDEIVRLHKELAATCDAQNLTRADLRKMYAASMGTATGFIVALAEMGVDIEPVKSAYLADLQLNFNGITRSLDS